MPRVAPPPAKGAPKQATSKGAPKPASKQPPKKAPKTVAGTVIIPNEKLSTLVDQAENLCATLKSLRTQDDAESSSSGSESSSSDSE